MLSTMGMGDTGYISTDKKNGGKPSQRPTMRELDIYPLVMTNIAMEAMAHL